MKKQKEESGQKYRMKNMCRKFFLTGIHENSYLPEVGICCSSQLINGRIYKKSKLRFFLINILIFKEAYSLTYSLKMIYNKNINKNVARLALAKWFNKVTDSDFKSFNTISATIYEHYDEILNFFIQRYTNASAESFNAKIKAFNIFLFRLTNIFA
jgi:hypothetical protein